MKYFYSAAFVAFYAGFSAYGALALELRSADLMSLALFSFVAGLLPIAMLADKGAK